MQGWKSLRPGTEDRCPCHGGSLKRQTFGCFRKVAFPIRSFRNGFPRQLLAQCRGHSRPNTTGRRGLLFACAWKLIHSARQPTHARPQFCEVAPKNGSQVISYGGGGVPTTIISGWFRFSATSVKPLTRLLPPLILVKADQAQSLALHTTLNMLASEMAELAPGSELLVNRLADLLFIHSIRAHIGSQSETCKSGLLRAIFDSQIVPLSIPCTKKWSILGQSDRWPLPVVCRVPLLRCALRSWLGKHRWNI